VGDGVGDSTGGGATVFLCEGGDAGSDPADAPAGTGFVPLLLPWSPARKVTMIMRMQTNPAVKRNHSAPFAKQHLRTADVLLVPSAGSNTSMKLCVARGSVVERLETLRLAPVEWHALPSRTEPSSNLAKLSNAGSAASLLSIISETRCTSSCEVEPQKLTLPCNGYSTILFFEEDTERVDLTAVNRRGLSFI
jgi:hypothetical protein